MKNRKPARRQPTKQQLLLQRYVLTGMAIGLYFGLFFRPARPANLVYPFALALLAAIVTLAFKAFRTRAWPTWQNALTTYLQFALLILALELRHYAYDWGGNIAVIVYMTFAGGVLGYLMARDGILEAAKV